MNLYQVVRWGNDSDDELLGGPDGPDTCFLVRADSPQSAAELADDRLSAMPHERVRSHAAAVYLLGVDGGVELDTRILRGPYVQHAFPHGWRRWYRNSPSEPWVEKIAAG